MFLAEPKEGHTQYNVDQRFNNILGVLNNANYFVNILRNENQIVKIEDQESKLKNKLKAVFSTRSEQPVL